MTIAEEGRPDVAVSDIVVGDGSLIVILDNIIEGLVAQNPVGGIEVGLPDCGGQDGSLSTL